MLSKTSNSEEFEENLNYLSLNKSFIAQYPCRGLTEMQKFELQQMQAFVNHQNKLSYFETNPVKIRNLNKCVRALPSPLFTTFNCLET